MAPMSFTRTPVVGSTKSSICDRRQEGEEEDDDERKEDETAARRGLRRLWLVVNGWQSDIRKVAWMAMPRKIAEGRAMMIGFGGRNILLKVMVRSKRKALCRSLCVIIPAIRCWGGKFHYIRGIVWEVAYVD
jgi:hypothetical protein